VPCAYTGGGLHGRRLGLKNESLRTALNDFLFSPIAPDEKGMHLTML
jgi:hypothetical protein